MVAEHGSVGKEEWPRGRKARTHGSVRKVNRKAREGIERVRTAEQRYCLEKH